MSPAERRALALREAEARRPSGIQTVCTLELRHVTLPEAVRVVADNAELIARLEEDAPVQKNELVTFRPLAFQAAPPEQSDGRWPSIELRLDGAASIIEPYLEAAMLSDAPIDVIWREYVRQHAEDGPGRIYRGMELDATRCGDLTVTGTAGIFGLDRRFGKTYELGEYPGLV